MQWLLLVLPVGIPQLNELHSPTGAIEMNTNRTLPTKLSFSVTLLVAALLALSLHFGSMAIDQMAGTQLTDVAAACHSNGGGC